MPRTKTKFADRQFADRMERIKMLRVYRQTASVTQAVRSLYPNLEKTEEIRRIKSLMGYIGRHGLSQAKALDTYLSGFRQRRVKHDRS